MIINPWKKLIDFVARIRFNEHELASNLKQKM
jgi:hypothetical protein